MKKNYPSCDSRLRMMRSGRGWRKKIRARDCSNGNALDYQTGSSQVANSSTCWRTKDKMFLYVQSWFLHSLEWLISVSGKVWTPWDRSVEPLEQRCYTFMYINPIFCWTFFPWTWPIVKTGHNFIFFIS